MTDRRSSSVTGTLRRVLRELRTVRWVAGLTVLSVTVSITTVELTRSIDPSNALHVAVIAIALFLCWAGPLLTATIVLRSIFRRHADPAEQFAILGACYFAIVLSFAGLYYAMSGLGDVHDVVRERRFYAAQTEALAATRAGDQNALPLVHRGVSQRSFRGMPALWVGAVDAAGSPLPEGAAEVPIEWIIDAAGEPAEGVLSFRGSSRFETMVGSFHLSVATSTTLGYGDISPHRWYAQLATDLQVLTSAILAIVGAGLLFGGDWRSGKAP